MIERTLADKGRASCLRDGCGLGASRTGPPRTALRRYLPAPAATCALLLAFSASCVSQVDDRMSGQIPRAEHGAAAMDYQIREFDRLVPESKVDEVPRGFDPVVWTAFIPEDNQMTAERVALGKKLFFDKRLSQDGTVSCATCHDVTRGFTDQRPTSEGIGNQLGRRNAPTTMNAVLLQTLFLDGRSPTLDHQARLPIINPIEMGFADGESAVKAIADDLEYQQMFKKAYGREVNYEDVGRAIGAFERTMIFLDSPFRRYLEGDEKAISADAKEGWRLFNEKARCVSCHHMSLSNPLGTDNRFHNVGVSARHWDFEALARKGIKAMEEDPSEAKLEQLALATDMSELGRFMASKNRSDIGAFRTSMLLNIGITPPYMHDGTLDTLWDVMDHYNKGGEANLFLDGGMEPLALTEKEIDQVVEFLFMLTDERFAGENRRQMEAQRAKAQKNRPFRDDEMANRKKLAFEDRISK
ncbi:MAG: cytochrome c peroxidase [Phycisphaerae bacterium]|nr:cytochrome c peroxidase [Phycisphaerae bacterium]